MSVIIGPDDTTLGHVPPFPKRKCALCGCAPGYPFLYWSGTAAEIIICRGCCVSAGAGLMADIIQVQAIHAMHAVGNKRDYTLKRTSQAEIKRQKEREEREEREFVKSLLK